MIVCVTEKPSVARDIARILQANDKRDGYYEGNGYQVTWTFGHLCTLKEPEDYTDRWKRWSLGQLPMIPERFGIKLIENDGVKRQFHVIESLIAKADEVVNCGDAGQEGELIQRFVYQKAMCNKPVKRLWISSLTDESIRQGFTSLESSAKYDNLYYAGLSRAIGDWLLGMNGTRLYSCKYSRPGHVLSVGRVQTPTLALIVGRDREIENFKPEDYWEIKTLYRDVTFNSMRGRYKTVEDANAVIADITEAPLTITSLTKKKGREAPPRLFDLTSLQVECNKKFSLSADEALRIIQSLYEKKVTTYPRVDTSYLTDDIYPQVPGIMRAMTPYAPLTAPLLDSGRKLPKTKKVFDNSKVTDHHAIIPTNVDPTTVPMSVDEKKVYNLIAKRFIAAFYPDCEFDTTTVTATVKKHEFRATGKVLTIPGWRILYNKEKIEEQNKDEENAGVMPDFAVGESGPHKPSLLKKTTQPPKRYTEGTLLRAMETAGKLVDDDELRDAMKENGIGRPSTRAAIIETLFKRHYISRDRKAIVSTAAGRALIDTIKNELLKSAKLTGLWEKKLRMIERGEYSPKQFKDELLEMLNGVVKEVLSDNSTARINIEAETSKKKAARPKAPRIKSIAEIECPLCHQGHLLKGRTAYGCSRYAEGCTLRLPFENYPADLTPAKLRDSIKKSYNKQ